MAIASLKVPSNVPRLFITPFCQERAIDPRLRWAGARHPPRLMPVAWLKSPPRVPRSFMTAFLQGNACRRAPGPRALTPTI